MADITAETIDRILELGLVETFEFHDLQYVSKQVHVVQPPMIAKVNVITLSALVKLYETDFEGIKAEQSVFHVTGETGVAVYANDSNPYAQRTAYATASFADVKAFQFGSWLDQETFIIGLQAHVKDSEDRKYLLELTSKISINDQLEVTDNGISQDVTAKSGSVLKQVLSVKPRVTLSPFRTFREIEQPASEFVFRVRKGARGTPELALFEADGGAWKLTAMASIAAYLQNAIADDKVTVIY